MGGPLHEPPAPGPDDVQRPRHGGARARARATPSPPACPPATASKPAAPAPRPTPTPSRRTSGSASVELTDYVNRRSRRGRARRRSRLAQPVRAPGDPDGLGLRGGEPVRRASGGYVATRRLGRRGARRLAADGAPATSRQARRRRRATVAASLISTDPPYYDNIGYSDLSDFFYVWLRRSLRDVHPDLLSTMLVPKAEELVANPYRHDGKDGAKEFFEDGFRRVFARARETALADYPDHRLLRVQAVRCRRRRDRLDGLGDAARRDDPLGLGDHGDLADAQRARRPDASASARTPSPRRSSSRCARAPTTRRRPTAAASSPRCTTSCPTRCASSSRARSRRSTCRRPRSAPGWRCSRATRR